MARKKKGISKSFSFFFMALHFIAFVLSICSLVLLLLANIGTTFSSSVLNKLYLVEISESVTGRSIRYGVYNSCLYYKNATDTANRALPRHLLIRLVKYSYERIKITPSNIFIQIPHSLQLSVVQTLLIHPWSPLIPVWSLQPLLLHYSN